ncbi:MAG: hypothetical protein WD005_03045, partial [Haliea sp.]
GGEGNYGGEEVAAASIVDDVVYMTQLGLMRGHLLVGVRLYERGAAEAAATHMKHPEDELYAALLPAFEARGVTPMDIELSNLARAVETAQPIVAVNRAYQILLEAITAAERVATLTPQQHGEVITELVATAAEEYTIARAEDGSVANVHEYQDSFGFAVVAQQLHEKMTMIGGNSDSVATIGSVLNEIMPIWPDLIPPARL